MVNICYHIGNYIYIYTCVHVIILYPSLFSFLFLSFPFLSSLLHLRTTEWLNSLFHYETKPFSIHNKHDEYYQSQRDKTRDRDGGWGWGGAGESHLLCSLLFLSSSFFVFVFCFCRFLIMTIIYMNKGKYKDR